MAKKQASMSISLPEQLKEYVRERSERGLYGTPSDYIRDLIREDLKRYEQKKLEVMLLEGLASGEPIMMTEAEQKKLENEVRERVMKKRTATRHE